MILLYTSLIFSLLSISSNELSTNNTKNNVKACLEAESPTPFNNLENGDWPGCLTAPGQVCLETFILDGDTWVPHDVVLGSPMVIIAPPKK